MWKIILVSFITFISVLGITEVLRNFWLVLMRPKGSPPAVMVVYLKEEIAIQQLRYALEFISWENKGVFSSLAVVTEGLGEKTFKEIKRIADNRSDVIFFKDIK